MKKWIIVEDRPWVMRHTIENIKRCSERDDSGIASFISPIILYYTGDTVQQIEATKKKYGKDVDTFRSETNLEFQEINAVNFNEKMDQFYQNKYIIFMDLNLTGNTAMYFNERINVKYAKGKQKNQQIWFYTTGASYDADFLHKEFPDNVIDVVSFVDGKAQLDIEKAWEILG